MSLFTDTLRQYIKNSEERAATSLEYANKYKKSSPKLAQHYWEKHNLCLTRRDQLQATLDRRLKEEKP